MRTSILAASLALLASAPAAEVIGPQPAPPNPPRFGGTDGRGTFPSPEPVGGGEVRAVESYPGRMAVSGSRQVIIQGVLDLDALQRENFTDADSRNSDHRGYGVIRAELATRVKMDEKVSATIGVGYRGEAGDYSPVNTTTQAAAGTLGSKSPTNSTGSQAAITSAFVELKECLGFEDLGVRAGRMPFACNLRRGPAQGALLYDARADDPVIGGWDGVKAAYSGIDTWVVTAFAFKLPDASQLNGAMADWHPDNSGDRRVFASFAFTDHRKPVMRSGIPAKDLRTFYGGLDAELADVDLWGEFAAQRGNQDGGTKFAAWGASGGLDYHFVLGSANKALLGVQADARSGDRDATDGRNHAFQDAWESMAGTYVVEHEKYGEIQRRLDGNLQAFKVRFSANFDQQGQVRLDLVGARYRLGEAINGGSRDLGHEIDATLYWKYTWNVELRAFGGVLFAGRALPDVLATTANPAPGRDPIHVFGANCTVTF